MAARPANAVSGGFSGSDKKKGTGLVRRVFMARCGMRNFSSVALFGTSLGRAIVLVLFFSAMFGDFCRVTTVRFNLSSLFSRFSIFDIG